MLTEQGSLLRLPPQGPLCSDRESEAVPCERRGAQIIIGLAEAQLAAGRLDQATDAARRSLDVFASRGSVSGLRRVRRFRDLLREGGHHREADQMDQHVRARLQEPR